MGGKVAMTVQALQIHNSKPSAKKTSSLITLTSEICSDPASGV